ncbi:MAG: M15 family metallopeptidase [Polyangiaceae bacterium]|nr:M15 family metallopeptidase [Polyangiaceae bacterium]
MKFLPGFGRVTELERRKADLFFRDFFGETRRDRRADEFEAEEQNAPQTNAPAVQQPYLPTGGRNFAPQQGRFNCAPTAFTVRPATFLPERSSDAGATLDAVLTAAGLDNSQRRQVHRAGLLPIAEAFGTAACTELFARLRWSAADIVSWGDRADSKLVPRLLIHIPGHFRELARRAPDAREAFVLECLGWLFMSTVRRAVASATRQDWWVPPAPAFVTAVTNPVPAVSAEVQRFITRQLYIDTNLTADEWNSSFTTWGNGLAGRQWQAEVFASSPGLPFYPSLTTIPAHVNRRPQHAPLLPPLGQTGLRTPTRFMLPLAATATAVTLAGLQNAVALRQCENSNRHLPTGVLTNLGLQGLELAYNFPMPRSDRPITRLALMLDLHPVFQALFAAIYELGWNDLLYQTSGGACFRGIKKKAAARVTDAGASVLVDPFNSPTATTVTRINTLFTPVQRAKVVRGTQSARNISEHGNGAAIDFNAWENDQDISARPFGSMDPRIVAIFEAFHFRFGGCFTTTDPMHFEYCTAACAPTAPTTGTLGPVVPQNLLLPGLATGRVIV